LLSSLWYCYLGVAREADDFLLGLPQALEDVMNKLTSLIVFMFCTLAFVTGQAGQAPSPSESPYPNELPNLKLYQQAKWNTLRPFVSTIDDIVKVFGRPMPVYDNQLQTYVGGYEDDPDWTIMISIVDKGGHMPDSMTGRLDAIELYPKKRVSLVGVDFPSCFYRDVYTDSRDSNIEVTGYYDKFGLRYSVYSKDSADGRFHAEDLKSIIYGPSNEDIEKYTHGRKIEP
jgi:hypothetical protein